MKSTIFVILFFASIVGGTMYFCHHMEQNMIQERDAREDRWQAAGNLRRHLPSKATSVQATDRWGGEKRTVVVCEDGSVWEAYRGWWKRMSK